MTLKRWQKRLLLTGGAGIVLLAFLYFGRPFYLSDRYLVSQIERIATASSDFELEIEAGRFALLRQACLAGITLTDTSGNLQVRVDSVCVHYRLLPLLRRRLIITQLDVYHPDITFHTTGETAQAPSSDSEVQPASYDIPDTSTVEPLTLPVEIFLNRLHVFDIALQADLSQDTRQARFRIGSIQFEGRDIRVKDLSDYEATMTVSGVDSLSLAAVDSAMALSATVAFDFVVEVQVSASQVETDARIRLSPVINLSTDYDSLKQWQPGDLSLQMGSRLIGGSELRVEPFILTALEDTLLQAFISIPDINAPDSISVEVLKGKLRFQRWWRIVQEVLPLFGLDLPVGQIDLSGEWILRPSYFEVRTGGEEPVVEGLLEWIIRDGEINDPGNAIRANGIELSGLKQGVFFPLDAVRVSTQFALFADSIVASGEGGESYAVTALNVAADGEISEHLSDPALAMSWSCQGPLGVSQQGDIQLSARAIDLANPAASPELQLDGGFSVDQIDLQTQPDLPVAGVFNTALAFSATGIDQISFQLGLLGNDLRGRIGETDLSLPSTMIRMSGIGGLSPDLQRIAFETITVDASPYGFCLFKTEMDTSLSWKITDIDGQFYPDELLAIFRPLLPPELQTLQLNCNLGFEGNVEGSFISSELEVNHDLLFICGGTALDLQSYGMKVDDLEAQFGVKGDLNRVELRNHIAAGLVHYPAARSEPFRDIDFDYTAEIDVPANTITNQAELRSDELGTSVSVQGSIVPGDTLPEAQITLEAQFTNSDTVRVTDDLRLCGSAGGEFDLHFSDASLLKVSGHLLGEQLFIQYADTIVVRGFSFTVPVSTAMEYTADGFKPIPAASDRLDFTDPVIFAGLEHLVPPTQAYGSLACDRVRIGSYRISNIQGMIGVDHDLLVIPRLTADAYDGIFQGSFSIKMPDMKPDSLRYHVKCSALHLNTALLPQVKAKKGEDSQITAFAQFSGQGIDPAGYFSIEGSLDITHIGRGVADNLLKFMDPNQNDPSIQTYRSYLRRGWGVKVFSFQVKDDFVYASLTPQKPPLSKPDMFLLAQFIGLGRSIQFGRVPIRFFLETPGFASP